MTGPVQQSPLWAEFQQCCATQSLPEVALPAPGEAGRLLSPTAMRFANCLLHPVLVESEVELLQQVEPAEVRLLQVCAEVNEGFKSAPGRLVHLRNFWTANLERALFAREVAVMLGVDRTLAFCAAFLQDVFLPLLTNQFCEEYVPVLEKQQHHALSLAEAERHRFGWNHADLAVRLTGDERFPIEFAFCIWMHHRAAEVVQDVELLLSPVTPVALSALLPDPLRQSPQGLERLFLLSRRCQRFNLLDIAERVDHSLIALERRRLNHIPLRRRCKTWLSQQECAIER